jgi:hypothetical protein
MRTLLAALLFGAIAVSDPAVADEPKTMKIGDVTYTERATIRQWDAHGKKFLNPVPNVWLARGKRKDADGKPLDVLLIHGPADNAHPTPGSVITDKDGNEYEVLKYDGFGYGFGNAVPVKQTKTAEKKPQ